MEVGGVGKCDLKDLNNTCITMYHSMDHLERKVHTCTIEIRAHFKSRTLTLRMQ